MTDSKPIQESDPDLDVFPLQVGQIEVGGAPFLPQPINSANTLHSISGRPTEDFLRLSIYQRDLHRCRVWMSLSEATFDKDARHALHIAALITFMTCFQSTSGNRVRPLSIKRIYTPSLRRAYSELLVLRNRSIAHDEQDFPINATGIELNADSVAEYTSTAIAAIPLDAWPTFELFPELIEIAYTWVVAERNKASGMLITTFNALQAAERQIFKNGPVFSLSVTRE